MNAVKGTSNDGAGREATTGRAPERLGIIGLGPVGMVLAAKLQLAGARVAVVVRNPTRAKRIREEGLRLEGALQDHATDIAVCESIAALKEHAPTVLFFATKTYQTEEAVQEAQVLNGPDLLVVSAQNGIDTEQMLAAGFGTGRTLRMVVNYAGNIIGPNTLRVNFNQPPNYLGSIDDSRSARARELAELLTRAGLETVALDSFALLHRSWEKTILNASLSALCGVGRLTMAEAMNDPDSRELIERIIHEAVAVAEQEKIRFPDDFIRHCMRYLRRGGDHFPSLAVDLIHGRPTEIDHFNGKIVHYGRKHYVRTSLNLAFNNMVKAMTNKNIVSRVPGPAGDVFRHILEKGLVEKGAVPAMYRDTPSYLGVDLGSAFTKFTVIDEQGNALFRYGLPTLGADRQAVANVMSAISSGFRIRHSCATGYGRKHFGATDLVKTEIGCAAVGVQHHLKGELNIIDIGGEDIKVIRCDAQGNVENFHMNDKCAAGTGAFLSEIAERARINTAEMSQLASLSSYDKELNSFCTVFAKTEIMNWIFDGMRTEDIARGIYLSIATKVAKLRLVPGIPTVMIGGVIGHHPYLREILQQKLGTELRVLEAPQYVVSFGAALTARDHHLQRRGQEEQATTPAGRPAQEA